jgi:Ca2+-binding RTX toxin-like protein
MNIKKKLGLLSTALVTILVVFGLTMTVVHAATHTTVVVRAADLATNGADVAAHPTKWFFYNDETDVIDNTLGSFVPGPGTAPYGDGSAKISVTGTQRRNLATYQFSGVKLADITDLAYSTYNPSAGNGGSTSRSGYLNFNVDFNGSDTWQKRLVFVPSVNGTVTQNMWKQWDAINGGNAKWSYSGTVWPTPTAGPHNGMVGVPGTTTRTWNEILADYPNIRIRVTDSWLGIRVGEPYADGYTEYIDGFKFGTGGTVTTFDFEPNATPTVTLTPTPSVSPSMTLTPTTSVTPTTNPYPVPAECSGIVNLNSTNPIVGTNGDNKIKGTAGNDLIYALDGADKVDGGAGNDCIVAGSGNDDIKGGSGNDVILGGADNDVIDGGSGNDKIYGESGNDKLMGGSGDDSLDGGAATDSADGGAGNDTCNAESEMKCEL